VKKEQFMAQVLSASEQRKKTSLPRNRDYRFLWIGQTFSLIGDYFFWATTAIWIIDKLARGVSWLPLAAGSVSLAFVMPSLLVSPFVGVWVDRWNKQKIMIWTDGMRAILVALFLLMTLVISDRSLLLIGCFVVILLVASGQQFFLPARVAITHDLVSEEQHMQAYGLLQHSEFLAQIIGPTLAALVYFALGPTLAILLDVLSFLFSLLTLLSLHISVQEKDQSQQMGFWRELREGVQFFVTNKILVSLLTCGMIFMFGGMVYNSFEYLYGVENLHITGAWLGLYVACYGVGVVIGLPVIMALAKRLKEVEVLWICLLMHGLELLVLSRMTSMVPGMICGFLMGITQSSVFVAVRPLTMLVTPRSLIGRVMSFEMPMITLASLLGGALASILASTLLANYHVTLASMTFGPLDTLLAAAGLLVGAGGVYARLTLYPAVREFRAEKAAQKQDIEPQQPEQEDASAAYERQEKRKSDTVAQPRSTSIVKSADPVFVDTSESRGGVYATEDIANLE
jgi:MFS family permease